MEHDNIEALNLLKTSKGQIEAIIRMTENGRYCVDISHQITAAISLLKKANSIILKNHIHTCVLHSFEEGTQHEKLEEVIEVLNHYLK
ncbi:MAG TPA: metal-sensing transcriptional repressor [Bacilli bacterium]|nr:metal-sensing transcriptional repressor [Bacilli bacterium]